MNYEPFEQQEDFHLNRVPIRGLFAGKRGGKTESGAVESVLFTEDKIGHNPNSKDPYLGVIIAPTDDMLRRLSLAKFFVYAKGFDYTYHQTFKEVNWHNGAKIYGISADKPQRIEGLKVNWIWVDEIFQCTEQLFLECLARVSDSRGYIWVTGSLGVQYTNPKQHWVYKHLKESKSDRVRTWEWATAANPFFPPDSLEDMRTTLDPKTFRQMFEIDWNVSGNNLVYDEFDEANIVRGYQYDERLETICSIDWGWTHPAAALFFQYDKRYDTVYLFDEIVGSKIKLEQLWERIKAKNYKISKWYCDVSGNQEREQTGISNINWFKQPPRNIHMTHRRTAVQYGIPIVRSYIKNGLGQRKFYVDEVKCPKSLDNIRNYSYQEKNGIILNENPLKKDDDCVDGLRYFFVNHLDYNIDKQPFKEMNRWKLGG